MLPIFIVAHDAQARLVSQLFAHVDQGSRRGSDFRLAAFDQYALHGTTIQRDMGQVLFFDLSRSFVTTQHGPFSSGCRRFGGPTENLLRSYVHS